MNNLKRFTVCKLAGHKWAKVGYPPSSDGETAGTFLSCQRCGKETMTPEPLPAAQAPASSEAQPLVR